MIILAFMPISLYYHDEHDKLLLMTRNQTFHARNDEHDENGEKNVENEVCPLRASLAQSAAQNNCQNWEMIDEIAR